MPISILIGINIMTAAWSQAAGDEYLQRRDYYVYQKCGSESASFIGGAAGRNRVEYVRCRTSARREFKRKWEGQTL